MGDERVWLRHGETGGYFHCPAAAAAQWQESGWEPSDPPEEDNPVIADRVAAEKAAAEQAAAQAAAAKPARKSTKASREAGTEPEQQEG